MPIHGPVWGIIPSSGGGGGIPEAPADGRTYGRKNSLWNTVAARSVFFGGGVGDNTIETVITAPSVFIPVLCDDLSYVEQNATYNGNTQITTVNGGDEIHTIFFALSGAKTQGGGNEPFTFQVHKDGVPIGVPMTLQLSSQPNTVFVLTPIVLPDAATVIELFVKNDDDSDDLTINDLELVLS